MKVLKLILGISRLRFFLILFCIGSQVVCNSQNQFDFNFGFETIDKVTELPANWFFTWGSDYHAAADSIIKHSGKFSASLEPTQNASLTFQPFGCVAQKIFADYSGTIIELRGFLKLENVTGFAGLLLRIDGESSILQFDNMDKKEIKGTKDWDLYSIILPYPKNAEKIYVGAILQGDGKIWIDDLEILIDGKNIATKDYYSSAREDHEYDKGSDIPLSEFRNAKTQYLTALGLVWGFMKYYHPKIMSGEINWDYELFRILPQVLKAKSDDEFNGILESWIGRYGKVAAGDYRKDKSCISLMSDLSWINAFKFDRPLDSALLAIKEAQRTGYNYYVSLIPDIGNPSFKNEQPYLNMAYNDPGFLLLSLYRYWNIIQYFYPHRTLIRKGWTNVLQEYIPKFIKCKNELDYKMCILELEAEINDSHAKIIGNDSILEKYKGINSASENITFIENKAVVISVSDTNELQVGDVVELINGKKVEFLEKKMSKIISASNRQSLLRNISWDLLRTNDSILQVQYRRNNLVKVAKLRCAKEFVKDNSLRFTKKDTCFKKIGTDIGYLYLGTLKYQYLREIFAEATTYEGLIIDLRCYPSEFILYPLCELLLGDTSTFALFSRTSVYNPGTFVIKNKAVAGSKNAKYYKGKVAILVNEYTQSQAEFTALALKRCPNAIVIGSTTAGADGDVSIASLPGGISTRFTAIGVHYPSGATSQQVGIVPDLYVAPTVQGIIEGRDEVLEKALRYIRQ